MARKGNYEGRRAREKAHEEAKRDLVEPILPEDASISEEFEYTKQRRTWLLSKQRIFSKNIGHMPYYAAQPHDEMCDHYDNFSPRIGEKDAVQRFGLVLAPRSCCKTTLISDKIPLEILRNVESRRKDPSIPPFHAEYVRATSEKAEKVLYEIKNLVLRGPVVKELWPEMGPADETYNGVQGEASLWSAKVVDFWGSRDPTISVGSVETGAAGARLDMVFIDDAVDEQNYDSIRQRYNLEMAIARYKPIMHPWGVMMVFGTQWPGGSFYGDIIKNNDQIKKLYEEAIKDNDFETAAVYKSQLWDIYIRGAHNSDGTLFYPSHLTERFLNQIKMGTDLAARCYPYWYENIDDTETRKVFPRDLRQFWMGNITLEPHSCVNVIDETGATAREIPVDVYITIDCVPPKESVSASNDTIGVSIVGCDAADDWWVFLCKEFAVLPDEMIDVVCLYLQHLEPLAIGFEPAGLSAALVAGIAQFITERGLRTRVEDLKHLFKNSRLRNKIQRVESMQPRYKHGKMHFQQGAWCVTVCDQMDKWPKIVKRDGIDSLSMMNGFAKPCRFREMWEAYPDETNDEDETSVLDNWNVRPYDNVKVAVGAPERLVNQMKELSGFTVNIRDTLPQAQQGKKTIGGHAGRGTLKWGKDEA